MNVGGIIECPFVNLESSKKPAQCPFHNHSVPEKYNLSNRDTPLVVKSGSHQVSRGTADLLNDIGGGDRIREFCTRFYARAFLDQTLEQFFLADWIIQKMGGEGKPWTDSGRLGMRQPSHSAAWHNVKRHPSVRGRHFKLGESRVWMRLHFWAVRESGLDQHTSFWNWYIQFIEHFIAVYESKAPRYAAADAEWSANPANLSRYENEQAHCMNDIAHLV